MKLKIRYSLRIFLLVLAVFSIWLGIRVNQAVRQRNAVAEMNSAGANIFFNWQLEPVRDADGDIDYYKVIKDPEAVSAPKWLRQLVGDEYFQHVVKIVIHPDEVDEQVINTIGQFPKLISIDLTWEQSNPEQAPKISQAQHDELVNSIKQKYPKVSVWARGL